MENRIETYGRHIAEGSTIAHDGVKGRAGLIRHLGAKEELRRSSDPDYHKAMQPIDSFCSEIEHWTEVHRGSRMGYLGLNVAWIAFRSSINEANIEDKIANWYQCATRRRPLFARKTDTI